MAYQAKTIVRPRIIANLSPHRTSGIPDWNKKTPGLAGLENCHCHDTLSDFLGITPSVYGAGAAIASRLPIGGGSTRSTVSSTATDAAAGATIGSVVPGVGTAIGAGVGAVIGLVSGLFSGGAPVRPSAADIQRCTTAVNQYATIAGKQNGRSLGEANLKNISWCMQAIGLINFTKDPRFFNSLSRWIGMAINNIAKNIMGTPQGTPLTQTTQGMKDDGGKAFKPASFSYTNPGPTVSADYVRDNILLPFMVAQCTPYSSAGQCRAEYTQPLFLSWLTDYMDWALSNYGGNQPVANTGVTTQIPVASFQATPATGVQAVNSAAQQQVINAAQTQSVTAAQLQQLQAYQLQLQQQAAAAAASGNSSQVAQLQSQLTQLQQQQQAAAAQYTQAAAAQVYSQAPAGSAVDPNAVAQLVQQQLASQGINTGGAVGSGVVSGIQTQGAGIFDSKNIVVLGIGALVLLAMAHSMKNSKGVQ